jgi:hypothetical protein
MAPGSAPRNAPLSFDSDGAPNEESGAAVMGTSVRESREACPRFLHEYAFALAQHLCLLQ